MSAPVVPPAPALAPQPAVPQVSIQENILWEVIGKMRELIKERGMKAALEQLEKPENQQVAATMINKLPEPGKTAILNALQNVIALSRQQMAGRRRTKRGGQNGAIQQLESNNTAYGALKMTGGNLGAVQQMVANTPYSEQPITPNTVYRNPWGGRRKTKKTIHRKKRV